MKNTPLALLGFILLTTPLAATAQFTYAAVVHRGYVITGYTGPGPFGAVTIPSSFMGVPVIAIGANSFQYNTYMTSLTIPASVTSIGLNAFSVCINLTNVTISSSVTNIGFDAFASCASLIAISVDTANATYSSLDGVLFNKNQTTLIQYPGGKAGSYPIPGSVTIIGNDAFAHSASLTEVTISGSVTDIGLDALAYCTSLIAISVHTANPTFSSLDGVLFNKNQTTLIQYPGGKAGSYLIPGSVTNVGAYAFDSCTRLTNVTIPGSVTSIGDQAFYYCTGLTNVTIPGSVTSIGYYAFAECASLTSVTILDGVTKIGDSMFYWCSSLTSVAIPGSVTSIGSDAFVRCTSLTNLTIPGSVTNLGSYVFYECTSLRGVFFKGNAPSFDWDEFDGPNYVIAYYLPGATGWGSYVPGAQTRLWNPLMQTSGVGPGGFGFNITGTTDIPIVVETAPSLANPAWVPLQSLNLTNGAFYFSDPNWTNYPARFYRIRSP